MKKLMILGAGVYQVPIITKAQNKGLYVIAVSPDGDYPGLKIADKVYHIDVRDKDAILKVAIEEKIDGITTDQTDIALRSVAYVAEQMGLSGIGYETACLFTDKYAMRARSEELGLPTIRNRKIDSLEEAAEFFNELGTSAIVKPVDNQGSRGVIRIDDASELEAAYRESASFSGSGSVIMEQFISGDEFEVDSLVIDGHENTLMYADLINFDLPGIFATKMRLYPSCRDEEVVKRLLEYNTQIIEGFGLKQGLTHSEFVVDKSGQPYLIEAAARGGGAFVSSDITLLQTGIDTAEYLVESALGKDMSSMKFDTGLCHCATLSFYLPVGEVVSVEGVEEAKALPFVHGNLLDEISLGMKTVPFSDKTGRYISVIKASSRDELMEYIDIFKNTVKIRISTESGIEGPIWE